MRVERTTIAALGWTLAAFAACAFLTSVPSRSAFTSLSTIAVACTCFGWAIWMRERVVDMRLSGLLSSMAGMLVLLMALQVVKYNFTGATSTLNRLCWYAYYVPLTWIPLLSFLAALCVGTRDDEQPLKGWLWLVAPALCLSVLFLANDAHQLAFSFPADNATWSDNDYAYGPLWYAEAVWLVALMASALRVAVARCARRVSVPTVATVLVPLAVGGVYLVVYALNAGAPPVVGPVRLPHFQSVFSIMVIGFWEALVQVGIIPSNSGYDRLFEAATFPAAIVDEGGVVHFSTAESLSSTGEQRLQAAGGAIEIGGDRILHSMEVPGGRVLWESDLSSVRAARRELEALREQQAAYNEALAAQSRLAEERASLMAQARIHEQCAMELEGSLAEVASLAGKTRSCPPEETGALLRRCLVEGTYVKRRANLRLVSYAQGGVPARELALALGESSQALREAGVSCLVRVAQEGTLDAEWAVTAYDVFHAVTQAMTAEGLGRLLVALDEGRPSALRIVAEGAPTKAAAAARDVARRAGASLVVDASDEATYLTLPQRGGDAS